MRAIRRRENAVASSAACRAVPAPVIARRIKPRLNAATWKAPVDLLASCRGVQSRNGRDVLPVLGRMTNKEIAKELGISFKTASAHRANPMQKLDIHDAANLVRHAIRSGILEP